MHCSGYVPQARRGKNQIMGKRENRHTAARLLELEQLLSALAGQYYRLALVVGSPGAGKTRLLKELCRRQKLPYVNINLELSRLLLELTAKERPLRTRRLLEDIIAEKPGDVIVLDNIELLFDPALKQDPLACLQAISRHRTLVVSWAGEHVDELLTYAEPAHPEYRRYEHPEAAIIAMP
jgi:hypothetical protein